MSDRGKIRRSQDRLGGPRVWLLLRLDRNVLSAAILAIVFLVVVGASVAGLSPIRTIVEEHNGVQVLFSAFIGAIITGTSVVVTINQLVLSQELGAMGNQRERMQEAMSFQTDVEENIEHDVSPPEPAAFLFELVDGIQDQANAFQAATDGITDADARERIDEYVDAVVVNADTVKDGLDTAQFGTFEVVWNALIFNYSRKIHDGRVIQAQYGERLSDEARDTLDELLETLRYFGPAREHFKTLYFQWELINLSRALLYVSIPALAVIGVMVMYVDAAAFPGATLGIDNLVLVTSAAFVVGIAPFVVFIAYILRITSIAQRTLAMGPFILRESDRD